MAKKVEATKLNIRPLGDRVVVQAVEEDEVTFAGGKLVLPETAKEKPQKGVVDKGQMVKFIKHLNSPKLVIAASRLMVEDVK